MVPSKGEVHREKCVDERRVLTMPPILALLRRRGNGLNRSGKARTSIISE